VRLGGSGARLCALAPVWPIPFGDPSPIPSASPFKLGPNSLPASSPSPPVVFGWTSVDPSIVTSALPSSRELNFGYMPWADRSPMVAPAGTYHSTAPRPMPGPSTGPRPGPVPSTEPLNLRPSSTCGTPLPLDCHRDRPWERPSEAPNVEPSGCPSLGPSVIPSPDAAPMVNTRPIISVQSSRGPALEPSDRSRFGTSVKLSSDAAQVAPCNSPSGSPSVNATCSLPNGRLCPRAEEWRPAKNQS
jgi:hypothetical protein